MVKAKKQCLNKEKNCEKKLKPDIPDNIQEAKTAKERNSVHTYIHLYINDVHLKEPILNLSAERNPRKQNKEYQKIIGEYASKSKG